MHSGTLPGTSGQIARRSYFDAAFRVGYRPTQYSGLRTSLLSVLRSVLTHYQHEVVLVTLVLSSTTLIYEQRVPKVMICPLQSQGVPERLNQALLMFGNAYRNKRY